MKQPGPLVKVLALVTSIALAAAYVAYRIGNARPDEKTPPAATSPTPPKDATGAYRPADLPKPATGSVPMMGGSKSLAPLIEPKDLEPKPAPAAPTQPSPK